MITPSYLIELQSLPLKEKVNISKQRIKEFYKQCNGKVYVSFSGGKDSTVLLHLVRSVYPDTPALFCDTGLEYPEIKEFVKAVKNVTWTRPKMTFKEVLDKYGYPIISKTVSMGLSRYRNTKSEIQRKLRKYGGINPTSGKKQEASIPLKWHYLIDSPFKFSEKCCRYIKKEPFTRYNRETNKAPFIGTMAIDSVIRKQNYLKYGCNIVGQKDPKSTPLGFWLEKNIWEYIGENKLPYSKIYDMGVLRTGCMFCMFGVHLDKEPNRFQLMYETHPKLWDYCINKLECGKILESINVPYKKYQQNKLF